jgi:hypothetical protein
MSEKEITEYSVSEKGYEEVDDAMKKLLEICQIYRLPMFASVAVANSESKTEYDRIIYTAQSHQMRLTNDEIRKHMLIAAGFAAVPPREAHVFDSEDIFDGDAIPSEDLMAQTEAIAEKSER